MYLAYWGLKEKPFQNTTDPRFFCPSEQHEEAMIRLRYAIEEQKGCALLTGVFGCGKTLLACALMESLPKDRYTCGLIFNPQLTSIELLQEVIYQLGSRDQVPEQKTQILHRLGDILTDNYAEGRHSVIFVDEAHLIEDRLIFEELRLLMNFQKTDRFLLTLILMGQPELREKISNLKALEQRISVRFHLKGMKLDETRSYILHRLAVAGSTEPIFEEDVFEMIHESSGGIPRRINQICDFSLLTGYGMKAKLINPEVLKEVVMDAQTF